MQTKNIKVEEGIWWELNKIKVDRRIKSLSEVIGLLIKESEKRK